MRTSLLFQIHIKKSILIKKLVGTLILLSGLTMKLDYRVNFSSISKHI